MSAVTASWLLACVCVGALVWSPAWAMDTPTEEPPGVTVPADADLADDEVFRPDRYEAPPVPTVKRAADGEPEEKEEEEPDSYLGKFKHRLGRMSINGSNQFTVRHAAVSGTDSAYRGAYWNTGTTTTRSSVRIEGPLPVLSSTEFGVRADWSESGYGRSHSRGQLIYAGHDTLVRLGDINVSLPGNQFARFSKPLKGFEIDTDLGTPWRLQAFASRERGVVRRETVVGNNTPGPYFLRYTPIMDGTEVVKVNEEIQRLGEDYRIDYQTGQLWFEPYNGEPKIIPSDATISVSYQSYGASSQGGTLLGGRLSGPLGKRGEVGLTLLQQQRDGAGARDTAAYQEDRFIANNSTGPFEVRGRPVLEDGARVIINGQEDTIEQAVEVLVDGGLQIEGIDYDIRRDYGVIEFRRIVPATSLVVVRYYYSIEETNRAGDATVIGLDVSYRLFRDFTLSFEGAQSSGADGNTGRAYRLSGGYQARKFSAHAEFRNTDPGFSYIDTVGFQRNERGVNMRVSYRPLEWIDFHTDFSQLKSTQGLSFGFSGYSGGNSFYGGGSPYSSPYGYGMGVYGLQEGTEGTETDTAPRLSVDVRRISSGVTIGHEKWPRLTLTRSINENSSSTRGSSSYVTNQMSLNWAPQKSPFSVDLSLVSSEQETEGYQLGTGDDLDADDPGTPTGASGSTSQQMRASLSYRPGNKLSLSTSLSGSRSRAMGISSDSRGTTMQFSANYRPWENVTINLDHSLYSSDGAVRSGYYGGIGSPVSSPGYNYNQYSPGGSPLGMGWGPVGALDLPGGITSPGGFTGDDDGDTATEEMRNRFSDQQSRIGVSYRPWENFGVNLGLSLRNYTSGGSIGYLADSRQNRADVSFDWRPWDTLSLHGSISGDRTNFLEEGRGSITNRWLSLGTRYEPKDSRWRFGLNVSSQSGTSPSYTSLTDEEAKIVSTSLFDVSGTVDYALSNRLRASLGMAWSDFQGGDFSDFARQNAELAIDYRFSEMMALRLGYQFTRNDSRLPEGLDGLTGIPRQSQDFTANIFTVSLNTTFDMRPSGGMSNWGGPRRGQSRFYDFGGGGYNSGGGMPLALGRDLSGGSGTESFGSPGVYVPGGYRGTPGLGF